MKMIIGGVFQGKENYARKMFPDICFIDGKKAGKDDILKARGILGLQDFVRNLLEKEEDVNDLAGMLIRNNPDAVIVCDEIGYGIVPMDPFERTYREAVGRICTELARSSDQVIRIVCGIPEVIRDLTKDLTIHLIRHGKTAGNLEARYVGRRTDESLCAEGVRELESLGQVEAQRIFVSPMRRCTESARILFPGKKYIVVKGLEECDFGRFEYRNYIEMTGDPEYQAWIDSGGTLPFPGGESREEFRERCISGFCRVVEQCILEGVHSAALVAHGGTIRSILSTFEKSRKGFFDWNIENGGMISVKLSPAEWNKGNQVLAMLL